MARIEKRVRELAGEPEMREAIEIVLDRAEDGEIQWVDVREDLTSGQWGRLIERGVLADGETGFALADREAIEAGLEAPEESAAGGSDVEIPDSEDTSWSIYDKAAGVVTLLFFVGYSYGPVRNVVGSSIDMALGPLQELLPLYAVIIVIATVTGLYSTLLRANLMDMDRMAAYQERMKDIQERRKEAKERGDDAAMEAIQEEQMEAMGDQLGMFKEQFRPMVWIMVFTIPAFLWMYWGIGFRGAEGVWTDLAPVVVPIWGEVAWTDTLFIMPTWIIWYFLCSMAFTQIIQKGLNISMSPSTS
ncbi:DUF106 domain-containing protein [Halobaculum lipolyticum]|uniref:DUF106 domain-containing protein n=1 Tax=Halobaculum lipolyticum TaxID=3032001 RepID=A0ABD5WH34_9EURY|nr:DUF106 domain-containing protein [Halobaculum sp. DT31]